MIKFGSNNATVSATSFIQCTPHITKIMGDIEIVGLIERLLTFIGRFLDKILEIFFFELKYYFNSK